MKYTDYAQVRQLAKDILTEYKKMALLSEGLRGNLKALEQTFLDSSIHPVQKYVNTLNSLFLQHQDCLMCVANELAQYASLLEKAKGNTGAGVSLSGAAVPAEAVTDKLRSKAVADAWKLEAERVRQGKGTRNWTVAQQAELLEFGSVSGFEGQHMKSVSDFPEYAGDPNNIQFLTYAEHLHGAHNSKWQNGSNGRLDLQTGAMIPFGKDEAPSLPEIELTDKYDPSQYALTKELGRQQGYNRHEDIKAARDRIFEKEKE